MSILAFSHSLPPSVSHHVASPGVVLQPPEGHLLILCAGPPVVGVRMDADAPARREQPYHLYVLRLHEPHEVFHYDVDAILVEVAVVAEAEQVELQALALHHALAGDVHYAYLGEVRLPCYVSSTSGA